MKLVSEHLNGVRLFQLDVFGDHRGFFIESFNERKWREMGFTESFIQDNHSYSAEAGVLRGLHYQLNPKAQTKLVRVTSGAIYDVVVDIRTGSPTYGQWAGFILSSANKRVLYVPKGFAHGFCTLVPKTEVQYKVDEGFSPELDRGILWSDTELQIDWPTNKPILSDKDGRHPELSCAEMNFQWGEDA
ncbi:dTDP-4-dehydrorhamnose 3,5-epimerase [Paenibacillus arenilitoris]|uniref:dTDP-4-dehydrorhamnose 3,5-epimerase n=1 Tax=Paenibacillus arenilitoris TaxID=2772299 RepID=A0A927H8G0_9BACL|nr:dTDP-4-dehydrorhamnose 3,5-epimerase [Paenibacillus arenilitoris]MBD2871532.1 dTDP-4-dehydrorhamnose 3,5-epimerase [Paenibacillus arenilitoris]